MRSEDPQEGECKKVAPGGRDAIVQARWKMKIIAKAVLIAGLFCGTAHADFSGDYAIGFWILAEDGGTIDVSGAPGTVSLTSNNIGTLNANQDLTFTAFENTSISFDWSYSTMDTGTPSSPGAQWDPFGYLLNGAFIQLSDNAGAADQNGVASFGVAIGDVFGFRANTVDGIFGAATTGVTNFSASMPSPATVPLPPSLWLMGFALGGFLMVRRQGRQDDVGPLAL
jgi:hypothetical protein